MKRLPLIMLMIVVLHDVHAEGPIHRTSFEELVRDATDIIVGSVLSTSKTGDNLRFQREYTLRILRIIKGAETNAVITIHQENFYPAVNVNPEQGQNYVVFLHHAHGDNKYQHQLATSVILSVFLDAIKREMCRTLKPLPRE